MIQNTYRCDKCKSQNTNGELVSEAYRLDASNFTRYRIEIMKSSIGPMNHLVEEYTVCNFCKDEFETSLNAIIAPLKANQLEMRS